MHNPRILSRSLVAPIVALVLFASSACAFEACVGRDAPGAMTFTAGGPGFDDIVSKSLHPDPKPGYVVKVSSEADVAAVVKCANSAGVPLCMRSGGHSFTGKGMDKTCALIDLIELKGFSYNASAGTVTVGSGNTLGEMFLKTFEATQGSGLVGIGLCPSVGVAGYLLGGGFNPYSASIGLTCESVEEFRFVFADGKAVKANSGENTELFWASCGGGGGAFAVLTSAVLRTSSANKFNQNVYFKYQWDKSVAGEVAHKHVNYDGEGGDTWVRVEFNLSQGCTAYGVCWSSENVENCEQRLSKSAFFNVGGRKTIVAKAGADVTEFQKFIGPAGNWASQVPSMSNSQAFIGTYGAEASLGFSRSYNSMFVRYAKGTPPQSVYDSIASIFFGMDTSVVAFNLIQFNPWRGAEKAEKSQHAFPHRDSDQLIEFIGGASDSNVAGGLAELRRGNKATRDQLSPWRSGIYINYPEFGLANDEYPSLYFGSSLQRLSALRGQLDPGNVFRQKQQIPVGGNGGSAVRMAVDGSNQCAGLVDLKEVGGRVEGRIQQYPFGHLSGIRAAVRVSGGCVLSAPIGVELKSPSFDGAHYDMLAEGGRDWSVKMNGEGCALSVISVNRIACRVQ